jgi:hypothetical protein
VPFRVLLDENVDPAVGAALETSGHDAVHTQDVDALGKQSHDHEIAADAKRTGRHVLTNDDDFYRRIDDELPTLFFSRTSGSPRTGSRRSSTPSKNSSLAVKSTNYGR